MSAPLVKMCNFTTRYKVQYWETEATPAKWFDASTPFNTAEAAMMVARGYNNSVGFKTRILLIP